MLALICWSLDSGDMANHDDQATDAYHTTLVVAPKSSKQLHLPVMLSKTKAYQLYQDGMSKSSGMEPSFQFCVLD